MAPPPSANLPLTERLLTLAKTLQFGWFVGHLTLILCTLRYFLSWIRFNYTTFAPRFAYRTAFVAAAATYGIVVYKTFKARAKGGRAPAGAAGAVGLLADENVQYLLLALVWLYSRQFLLALLPYTIFSVFHVATYTRTNLIPTLAPPAAPPASTAAPAAAGSTSPSATAKPTAPPHPVAESIGKFVKQYYDSSMSIVALLEIVLWFRLLLSAITFSKGSWILIALYTAFLRARFAQSSHVQSAFGQIEARVDNLTGAQGMNPTVRQVWDTVKGGVRQAYAATDVQKYIGGAQAPRKTQ
ncbi:Transmembrane nucleoporin [Sporothrix bragantina]|uniref:Transmembrane nucleoporin n=1 Tax=Sporothrix bragantina TaxID=671064 RepID=A0ABP0B498_9PEZI